jgi:hypothetical protein
MDQDIYKPPQADLTTNLPEKPDFYVVSERKLLILAISTLGIYYVYWFYQHWKNQKLKYKENIWPVARSIFSIFFTHSLFNRIQGALTDAGKNFSWSPNLMATVFILFSIISDITNRLSRTEAEGEFPLFTLIGLLSLIPIIFSTYKAQQAANLACNDPLAKQNSQFTLANFLWIGLGVLFWLLMLFGLYISLWGLPASMIPME